MNRSETSAVWLAIEPLLLEVDLDTIRAVAEKAIETLDQFRAGPARGGVYLSQSASPELRATVADALREVGGK